MQHLVLYPARRRSGISRIYYSSTKYAVFIGAASFAIDDPVRLLAKLRMS